MNRISNRSLGILLAGVLLAASGCAYQDIRCREDPIAAQSEVRSRDFAPYQREPKARIGSVPCIGGYTLFKTADADRLGRHHYGNAIISGQAETRRGIVYTTHGGFIDIAHLRKAADWTAFHHARLTHALNEGWRCIILPSKEASTYHIRFRYPDGWDALPEARKQAVREELAIVLAQRLAIMQTNWHEIATWFGYQSTPLPEKASAFSYDDTTSHILGAQIAGLALRDPRRDYDEAVTFYLRGELARLGAVKPEQTIQAIRGVEGRWWKSGRVTQRQLDIGENDGVVMPWIVPGFPDGATAQGLPFAIPLLNDVAGVDMRGFEMVEIDPRLRVWSRMRKVLPSKPQRCIPEDHFPLLMAYIREAEGEAATP